MLAALEEINLGFRHRYLTYDQLTAQLEAWARSFPHLARLSSLGKSVEGRELWLLTLGPDPDRERPSAWVDGNMHAQEVCGSNIALAIAEEALRLHLDPGHLPAGLPAHAAEALRRVRLFVMPRMCPDGAEAILTTARYCRSNPRDRRPSLAPRWVSGDVDGDGLALLMRKVDPSGDYVESRAIAGLLVPRELEDEGPFYRLYPEGFIENFSGDIPESHYLSDNDTDLNRNFPWSWAPEPEQIGAGSFAASEPESRAVVSFTSAQPTIFAWLNLHTFGGVYIRPLGHKADRHMNQHDLAIFRQLEEWGEQHGGYPTVSGFEEFLYEPDKPLRGDLSDYAYHQRGALSLVCELWDLFAQAGIPRKRPFSDVYFHLTRADLEAIARLDLDTNEGRCLRPWVARQHPQLGPVEVGGVDNRFGMVNPPLSRLAEVCSRQWAFFARWAAMAPLLEASEPLVTPLGPGLHRVEIEVANRGYLSTSVTEESKALPWNQGVFVEALADGLEQVEPAPRLVALGHLAGWGHGRFNGNMAIFFQRSQQNATSRRLSFVFRGRGSLRLRVGGPRLGWVERSLTLP